jgi:hypothetical protein
MKPQIIIWLCGMFLAFWAAKAGLQPPPGTLPKKIEVDVGL